MKIQDVLDIHNFKKQRTSFRDIYHKMDEIIPGAFKLEVNDEVIRVYVFNKGLEEMCYLEHYGEVFLFNIYELSHYLTSVLELPCEDDEDI